MNTLTRTLRPALSIFVLLTFVTGLIYPLLVTGIAQLLFSYSANASPRKSRRALWTIRFGQTAASSCACACRTKAIARKCSNVPMRHT